ncbi:hypothetical protein IF1G_09494 [Cordyceps javanica]|uniref:Uncharacterized protein n=1 Tax=Cordyceps javanica TaxID=43265 RepID=A0A545UR26_9HYPO|nr:hypothetical protein IF1G_09494 [Cordyceps javanica]
MVLTWVGGKEVGIKYHPHTICTLEVPSSASELIKCYPTCPSNTLSTLSPKFSQTTRANPVTPVLLLLCDAARSGAVLLFCARHSLSDPSDSAVRPLRLNSCCIDQPSCASLVRNKQHKRPRAPAAVVTVQRRQLERRRHE